MLSMFVNETIGLVLICLGGATIFLAAGLYVGIKEVAKIITHKK